MSEIRYNYLKDTWVLVSEERARRPHDYATNIYEEEITDVSSCPFEYGNEEKTPHEVFAIRNIGTVPNTPGWKVRVIPNKYPAVKSSIKLEKIGEGIYDKLSGFGFHEVIIDTPNHFKHIQSFTIEDFNNMFIAFRERLTALSEDKRIRYIHIFKNHGKEAGKSLVHSHSQLIALPIIPKTVDTQLRQSRKYFRLKERCYLCDEIKEELKNNKRVIFKNEKFIVYCPFASLFSFEIRIAPIFHSHDFRRLNNEELNYLSEATQIAIRKLNKAVVNPPFNMILHTSPPIRENPSRMDYFYYIDNFFHWYIEILPRINILAGFELGTGCYINPTSPEMAAKILREVIL